METITLADGTVLENATVVEDPEAYVLYFYVYTSGTLAEIFNLMNDPEKTATIRAPAKLPVNTISQCFKIAGNVTPGRRSSQASGVSMNTPVTKSYPIRYSMQNPTGNRMAPTMG